MGTGGMPQPRRTASTGADAGASTGSGTAMTAHRVRGLDGLRALAVLGVMAFHFGAGWLPGGFFSLDLFFVLSGFLITGLLLGEYGRSGKIRLGTFWARRARRLLPALALMLLAVTCFVHFVAPPDTYPGFRLDGLSALFYFSNWHQIAASTNYFVANGPVSPLTHTWSLSVEEQFYLVWPLVLVVVLSRVPDLVRATRFVLGLSVAGALASTAWMAWLFAHGATTTRLYFGTDTHAQSIMVGAALACWLQLHPWNVGETGPDPGRRWARTVVDGCALGCLAGIVLFGHLVTEDSSLPYRGGFLLVSCATAVVILAIVRAPGSATARLLSLPPLPWIGRISYGLYLWHFPLSIYLSPERTHLSGASLAAVRVAATFLIATVSFYAIERPVLERRFWRTTRALFPAGAGAAAVTGAIVAATVAPAAVAAPAVHFRARTSGTASAAIHVPARVVVLGDSTALTLSVALEATAPAGTRVTEEALYSCGLPIGSDLSADAPDPGLTLPSACNESSPPDQQWPALDEQAVAGTGPGDVVVYLGGHNDIQDILQHGTWSNILSGRFQRAELAALEEVEAIATSHGAHLDLLTMPCVDDSNQGGIPPEPTEVARRQSLFNHMLEAVAAANPAAVSLVHYRAMLCPRGQFTFQVNGVEVRSPDGVHTPAYDPGNPYAGNSPASVAARFYPWLAARLWPKIMATNAGTAPPAGAPHPAPPSQAASATGSGRSSSGRSG